MGVGVPYQLFYRSQLSPQESGRALFAGGILEDVDLMKVFWAMLAGIRTTGVMNRDMGVNNRK